MWHTYLSQMANLRLCYSCQFGITFCSYSLGSKRIKQKIKLFFILQNDWRFQTKENILLYYITDTKWSKWGIDTGRKYQKIELNNSSYLETNRYYKQLVQRTNEGLSTSYLVTDIHGYSMIFSDWNIANLRKENCYCPGKNVVQVNIRTCGRESYLFVVHVYVDGTNVITMEY